MCFATMLALFPGQVPASPLARTTDADPSGEWLETSTRHFRAVYPAGAHPHIGGILTAAEEAYALLSAWSGREPPVPIPLLVSDGADHSGGSVNLGTRGFYLQIYPVHPYNHSDPGTDHYADWYRTLLLRKLSEYFYYTKVEGFPRFLSTIFGDVFYPNLSTPRFYTEGLSSYAATLQEENGPTATDYHTMLVRTAVLGEDLPPIDQVCIDALTLTDECIRSYGTAFLDYLVRGYGNGRLHRFSFQSAGGPVYTWGVSFRQVYGITARHMWKSWQQSEQGRFMEHSPRFIFETVSDRAGEVHSLCWDPAGERLVYSMDDREGRAGLYLYDTASGRKQLVRRGLSAADLTFTGEDTVCYLRSEYRHGKVQRQDIYELDLKTGREKRVTRRGRIQSFAPAEGGYLVCTSAPWGTELRFLRDGGDRLIYPSRGERGFDSEFTIIEGLSIAPDREKVAFCCKAREGGRGVYVARTADLVRGTFEPQRAAGCRAMTYDPFWIDNELLGYVRAGPSRYTISAVNTKDGTEYRAVCDEPGLFLPCPGRDGSWAVKMACSRGFQVAVADEMVLEPVDAEDAARPGERTVKTYSGPPAVPYKCAALRSPKSPTPGTGRDEQPSHAYRPLTWMAPGYWLPVYTSRTVDLGAGIAFRGSDLLQRHLYSAALVYDFVDRTAKTEIRYTRHGTPFALFLNLYLEQDTDAPFAPEPGLYPGLSFALIRGRLATDLDVGFIYEESWLGPHLQLQFSALHYPRLSLSPTRGWELVLGGFLNTGSPHFTVLTARMHGHAIIPPFRFSMQLRTRTSSGPEAPVSGKTDRGIYAPLDGLHTPGYPEPVDGHTAADLQLRIGLPLVRVNRGPGGFPVFFRGAYLHLFTAHCLAASGSPDRPFVMTGLDDLSSDALQYIRSSVGPELQISTIISYSIPVDVWAGYVYAPGPEGRSGLQLRIESGFSF